MKWDNYAGIETFLKGVSTTSKKPNKGSEAAMSHVHFKMDPKNLSSSPKKSVKDFIML